VSDYLITLDLAEQGEEKFSNDTLPPDIPGRANPELVWVPVGSRGILVALGGVVYPDFVNTLGNSTNVTASVRTPSLTVMQLALTCADRAKPRVHVHH
jgi:hypothetical protein